MKKTVQGLLTWFEAVKRPMPWRTRPAPYPCWVSEIMMQQTTYQSVLPYYARFLKAFPTVQALAEAPEERVLQAWAGLGYYARARNLHAAAKRVVAEGWPDSAAAWARLPGVGPYTAAALSSVLAGEKIPVVDGNVARVFARYWRLDDDFRTGPARKRLADRLQAWIADCSSVSLSDQPTAFDAPGMFNQAMMELGALVCTPTRPSCASCPLMKTCAARRAGQQENYPVKAEKKIVPVRQVTWTVVTDEAGRVLLTENKEGGLLKGLWELPAVEPAGRQTHVFSHFKQEIEVVRAVRQDARFVDPRKVPLATAARKVLSQCGLL
jgi:A/G-specific adenine glycosylase